MKAVKVGLILGAVLTLLVLVLPQSKPQAAPTTAAQAETAEHNAKALKVAAGAVTLRKLMRNPASFSLVNALLMKDGSVCYDYRAQNGFGGMNEDQATMTPKGKVTADPAVYGKFCTGKVGEDFVAAQ